MNANIENSIEAKVEEVHLSFRESLVVLAVVSIVCLASNWAGTGINPIKALPAMLIIYGMIFVGLLLTKYVRIGFPAVAWVSLISVLLTIPVSPVSAAILSELKNLNFLSIVTPVLAYAAMAITKMEVDLFKRSGFKIAVISILVFTGTYVGSALVANALL
ncbi:hypothetical protein MSP8887_03998 [Marinomonas spartinae]|uniref:Uncharacterized protein n=1 Tax=Marinomonas spartinae TaxID=1792290 RepID=A0A1A8T2A0_9GAMM|nr:hypothetical protein [Marinomonas spartinae]SBS25823.1 hypothetical protein MSP8886_00397 [Marinomonas spartinae]SBS39775.1 hypothetical protein MSP8887_03998 [Marinomonas spartinae]